MKYGKLNIIIVLLIFSSNINKNLAINHNVAEKSSLYKSYSLILKQAFSNQNMRLLFYVNCYNSSKLDLFYINDAISGFLYDINDRTYKILYQYRKKFVNLKHNEIIIFDNVDSFKYFYGEFYKVGNINLSRTLMFISSIRTLDFEAISSVFKDLYHMSILNVALVVALAPDDIVMLTYFPFTPKSCHDFSPVIISRYLPNQDRWSNMDYFPKKLHNFYGCPLICCTWDDMPYFSIQYDPTNKSIIDYVGMEAELLKFAAERLNFSIRINLMSNDIPKHVYNDGAIFAKLFSETCDFALGGFAYKKGLDQNSPFSQTNQYALSHIQMVTRTLNEYTTYEKIAFPFHYVVWYTLIIIIAVSSALIFICERRGQWSQQRNFIFGFANRTPHYYLHTLALGGNMTTQQVPKRNFARFLLINWLLGTFVLRTAYQSGIYQMLRDNKQRNLPDTIQNVIEQNYLISMTPENQRYLPILPELKRIKIFNSTILQVFPELLNFNEPLAFIAPQEYFEFFGHVNKAQWRRLHLVKERIITQQLTCYVRHHSYLINVLNEVITDAQCFGFNSVWIRGHTLRLKNNQLSNDDEDDNVNPRVLSMHELTAVLMILVWFHLISTAVFFLELIWFKFGKLLQKKIKNYQIQLWQKCNLDVTHEF